MELNMSERQYIFTAQNDTQMSVVVNGKSSNEYLSLFLLLESVLHLISNTVEKDGNITIEEVHGYVTDYVERHFSEDSLSSISDTAEFYEFVKQQFKFESEQEIIDKLTEQTDNGDSVLDELYEKFMQSKADKIDSEENKILSEIKEIVDDFSVKQND
jgi:RecJ-like exonuclease